MAKEILIADSDKADQEEFQKIFETTNYHLIFSESGEDVLFRVKLFKPDLIITSVRLKDKNGFELCEAIKTDPEYKHVPFILLSNIFEEISEEDRRRVHADGVISKPLREDEILNLIDQLMEEESMEKREEKMVEKEMEWKSFAEIEKTTPEKTEELSLDEPALAEEEEIIELVDVVEESEVQMSIDDFTVQKKEEIWGEITPLESWGRLEEEQKPSEKEFLLPLDEKEMEIERKPSLPFEKEVKPKEAAPEEELFEKIELEEKGEGKFGWGAFTIDVSKKAYVANVFSDNAFWIYSGKFVVDSAGRCTAQNLSKKHGSNGPSNKPEAGDGK